MRLKYVTYNSFLITCVLIPCEALWKGNNKQRAIDVIGACVPGWVTILYGVRVSYSRIQYLFCCPVRILLSVWQLYKKDVHYYIDRGL
jgi:hypothetical protein